MTALVAKSANSESASPKSASPKTAEAPKPAPRALYRKYRPTKLKNVVGQDHIITVLQESLKSKTFSHAYLFTGPRGTGKTSVARIFAHELNGFKYAIEDDYLDIIEIDAASNRGIDNIRELREKVLTAPALGKYKVYIIDEVHMLTREAFNALLKTLEEPPKHVVFIMATTNPEKVLATITSRSQVFSFRLADTVTMTKLLQKIAKKEDISITKPALEIIARRGGGSFRDSLSLLDQISTLTDDKITPEIINHALGLPQDDLLRQLLADYQSQDLASLHAHLAEIFTLGCRPEVLTSELVKLILDTPDPTLLPLLDGLTKVAEPFAEAKLLLALIPTHMQTAPFSNNTPRRPVQIYNTHNSESKPTSTTTAPTPPFDWPSFLESFRSDHPALYTQLSKSDHEPTSTVLKIYPPSKIGRNILNKENNHRLLVEHAGRPVEIIDPADRSADSANSTPDSPLTQISAIMGNIQEVKVKHGGKSPFA